MWVRHTDVAGEAEAFGRGYSRGEIATTGRRQYARWRVSPPPPTTLKGRLLARKGVLMFVGIIAIAWMALGAFMLLLAFLDRHIGDHDGTPFGAFGPLFIAPLAPVFIALRQRSAPSSLQSLMAVPSPSEQYPVRMELMRSGCRYAVDYGFLMFVEDSVVYNGLNTEFSFSRGASDGRSLWIFTEFWESTKLCQLGWYEGGETFHVMFLPQMGLGLSDANVTGDLWDEFQAWSRMAPTSDANVLPPVKVQPDYLAGLRRATRGWLCAAAMVAGTWILWLVFLLAGPTTLWSWSVIGIFLFILGIPVMAGLWIVGIRSWALLRRLDHWSRELMA